MELKSKNKISANEYELEIAISPDVFNKEVDKVYKKEIKSVAVPGFRKGKAPRAFVEKYYGENVFHEDAVKNLYPSAIEEASKKSKIDLVGVNKLDIVKSSKEEGLVFKVVVVSEPDVNIGKYKGIEIKEDNKQIGQEDVDKEIERVLEKNSRLVKVDSRNAKIGDTVLIDFEGFIDGKAFDGGKATNFNLQLGKKQFIEGFEDKIVGHKTGDEFEIQVKFPEEYHSKECAGKEAVFKVVLHEIKERELPAFDDEFVKDISEFDTVEEYKENLRSTLDERNKKRKEEELDKLISDKLVQLTEADIPDIMIEKKIDSMVEEFKYHLNSQGVSIKDYETLTGFSSDKVREQFKTQAQSQVKLSLALKKIAELEKISVTGEEIEKKYDDMAKNYKVDRKHLDALVDKSDIEKDIKFQKAMELVKNNIVLI